MTYRSPSSRRLIATLLVAHPASGQSPPTADSVWNNFISSSTLWGTSANWLPAGAPTSSIDRVLGFDSSFLQTAGGYTSTFNLGAFDLNSLVFNSSGASNAPILLTGNAAGDTLRFSANSTGGLPTIWQLGSGQVAIRNGNSTAGITLNNGTTLHVLGSGIGEVQINATIAESGTGSSGLLINQTGTGPLFTGSQVRLAGSGSTFSGGVTLTAGNLVLSNANSAGTLTHTPGSPTTAVTALGTGTFTVNGGSLQFDPTAFTSATGPVSGTFSVGNAVQLNSTLTLTGTNTVPLGTMAPPVGNIVGVFTGAIGGTGGITVAPSARFINYAFTGSSNFTGPVVVRPVSDSSTLHLGTSTSSGGQFTGVTSFTVGQGGALVLNNFSGVQTRLNTTTAPALTLDAGTLNLWGNSSASAAETFGTLTVNGGGIINALTVSPTAQTATLTFAGLNRAPTAALIFAGTNLGSGTAAGEGVIRFLANPGGAVGGGGPAGTPTVSILPYAYVDSSATIVTTATTNTFTFNTTNGATAARSFGLARWDATSQRIVPLNPATEYATNLFLVRETAPTANHRYSSTAAASQSGGVAGLVSPTTVNALVLDPNLGGGVRSTLSLDGPATLTVAGGTILVGVNGTPVSSFGSMINLGGLNFGTTPGYIHTAFLTTINSPISGSGGVVKAGFTTLVLNGVNTFTGGLTVGNGQLFFTTDANLGAAGQPIVLSGGNLNVRPDTMFGPATATTAALNRPITIAALGGTVTVANPNNTLTLAGTISGTGTFTKPTGGVLVLTGTNTFTGDVVIGGGILAVPTDAALGNPSNNLILSGTFQPTATFASNRNILVASLSPTIVVNGVDLTLGGTISSQAAVPLLKDGTGDLILTGTNTFTGAYQNGADGPRIRGMVPAVTTSGRTILTGANGSMPLAAGVISRASGEVVLDNVAAVNNNRIGTVPLTLDGGNVTLIGNASAPVNEAIGALTIGEGSGSHGGTLTLVTPAGSGQSTTLTATGVTVRGNGRRRHPVRPRDEPHRDDRRPDGGGLRVGPDDGQRGDPGDGRRHLGDRRANRLHDHAGDFRARPEQHPVPAGAVRVVHPGHRLAGDR